MGWGGVEKKLEVAVGGGDLGGEVFEAERNLLLLLDGGHGERRLDQIRRFGESAAAGKPEKNSKDCFS